MEPNVDRGMWSVVALLAAIVIGGVVLLAFPRISGKIVNSMNDTVDGAFSGDKPSWVVNNDENNSDVDVEDTDNNWDEEDPFEPDIVDEHALFKIKTLGRGGRVDIIGFDQVYIDENLGGVQPKEIVIPKEISIWGDYYIVEGISENAFQNKNLTKITFEEGVENIGANAFKDNKIAGVLKFPETLTKIGDSAFEGNMIEDVVMGKNLKDIGKNAFSGNLFEFPE